MAFFNLYTTFIFDIPRYVSMLCMNFLPCLNMKYGIDSQGIISLQYYICHNLENETLFYV